MARLQTWSAATRRSKVFWVVAGVVVVALVAGGIVLATRPSPTPPPALTSTRAVALGDSVPYGHGLANPYLTPQLGLPAGAVSQAPSAQAYPSLVARSLGLTMSIRPTNCDLRDDQLAISGAVADPVDDPAPGTQCPGQPQPLRNLDDEVAAADLPSHPARLVILQAGADDVDFAACLEFELARIGGVPLGLGTPCVAGGRVTPALAVRLSNVRTSLARVIESMAPHAGIIAVVGYYQPVPAPTAIADDAAGSGGDVNLVCAGLEANAATTFAAAQVVASALNEAIAGAVAEARAHGVRNVTFVDIASVGTHHGICTADPWFFSAEPTPDTTLTADVAKIAAAKVCDSTSILKGETPCADLTASAAKAEQDLRGYVWRAAHPTADGQRAIAAVVEGRLHLPRSRASGSSS